MGQRSGVGVLDRAALVLDAAEAGPASLADLVERTGLSRATAHRLAVSLEVHGLLARDPDGRFVRGPRLAGTAAALLLTSAAPVLRWLRDQTGESSQLYVRSGPMRLCVAAADRESGLRDTVPVGTALPMTAGSGAQVLLAWEPHPDLDLLARAAFDTTGLERVRRQGWAATVGEREPGLASVSAPVRDVAGAVVAALSLSGPVERLTRSPGRRHGPAVVAGAGRLRHDASGDDVRCASGGGHGIAAETLDGSTRTVTMARRARRARS